MTNIYGTSNAKGQSLTTYHFDWQIDFIIYDRQIIVVPAIHYCHVDNRNVPKSTRRKGRPAHPIAYYVPIHIQQPLQMASQQPVTYIEMTRSQMCAMSNDVKKKTLLSIIHSLRQVTTQLHAPIHTQNGEVSARNAFDAKQGAKTKERRKRKTTMEHERKSTERRRNFSNKECFEVWKSIANVSIWSLVGSLEFETHLFVASQMLWWPDIRRCSFAWQDHKQWLWFCIHQLTDA